MDILDIISKKRDNKPLSKEEIFYWINGLTNETIPLYQSSALCMAIVLNGMQDEEIYYLTSAMIKSGDILDLSSINGYKADKHSTGGVGDKTSLVLLPMVASLGLKIAKLSGRGLGHTGGTLDKLEAIPGLSVNLDESSFIFQVNNIGLSINGQTKSLTPADKKLYALRDVTGTVQSIPLIASSVMSKKIASGADNILLDITVGSGAFMKDVKSATKLATLMLKIAKHNKRNARAIISNMDEPLGHAVGNILEIKEVISALKGNGPSDLMELCYKAGSIMLVESGLYQDNKVALNDLKEVIANGNAFIKFKEMVAAQGGDTSYLDNPDNFINSKYQINIYAPKEGYIKHIDALGIGIISNKLGAGRMRIEDTIDFKAGIYLYKKVSDYVTKNDKLATIYTDKDNYQELIANLLDCYDIVSDKVNKPKLILKVI